MSAEVTTTTNIWGGGNKPMNASYGKLMMWFFILTDALTFSGFLVAYGFARFKFGDIWPVAEDVFTHFPGLHGNHPLLFVALMTFILIMSSVTMVLAVHHGHRMRKKQVVLWMALTIVGGAIFLGSQAWEWMHFIMGTDAGAFLLADGTVAHLFEAGQIIEGRNIQLFADAGATLTSDHALVNNVLKVGEQVIYVDQAKINALVETGEKIYGANLHHNEYGHPLFADFFFFITGFHGFHVFTGVLINVIIFVNVLRDTYEKRGHYEMIEKVGLYWHFVDLVWVFVFTFFYLI
ncbi:MAG: cytochrome c oxidase subunit 3 [Flavobacteriales bacterium]|nr:cytochrome c oxidase subunit 3 [Flavobacteriales bacterium]